MYAFEYYANEVRPGEVINAQLDSKGWHLMNLSNTESLPYFRYNQNFNFKEQFELTKEGIKKFEFINGKPYSYNTVLGKKILFKGIHFQGQAKYEMLKLCNEPMSLFSKNWWQYYIIYGLKKIKGQFKKLFN